MKITDICESTTSGSIATVSAPMNGGPLKRSTVGKGVYGKEPAGSMFKGEQTSKPFANSKKMNEAAGEFKGEHVTVLYVDGKPAVKYTDITKAKKELQILKGKFPNKKLELKQEVREAKLEEDDLIIVPGQGHKKGGFISRADDRRDHEVEMARSDLYQAHKNSSKIHKLIKNVSEDEGLEGWVQAKITKAADYLNSVRQYLEGKKVQEMTGGVIAGGGVGEGIVDKIKGAVRREKSKDLPLVQTRRDYAMGKGGDAYNKGETRKGDQYMAWAERDRKKKGDPTTNPDGGYRTKTSDYTNEGAKVDRMVKHIKKSERGLGKSEDEASDIAWATANKRGMLDNKKGK